MMLSERERIANALRSAAEKLEASREQLHEPIAVVGLSCRFPGGADTPEKFWKVLRVGIDTATDVPADRFKIDDFEGRIATRKGCFVPDAAYFDPQFFRISPKEALMT